jgi:uncharacterized protein YbjT (DUF2867 family)
MNRQVFISGSTGYIGSRLTRCLVERGFEVRALARQGSEQKLRPGPQVVTGNALDASSFQSAVRGCDTFVQLIGTAHPSPAKAKEFRAVDAVSAKAAIAVALYAGVRHFVYVSVAHPAPVMQSYIDVRVECEQAIRSSGLHATILRPWYVLGPGHYWPYLLVPLYWTMRLIPATRESALRLGLVTLGQMIAALTWAVENPPEGVRVLGVPQIRSFARRG